MPIVNQSLTKKIKSGQMFIILKSRFLSSNFIIYATNLLYEVFSRVDQLGIK